MNRRLSYLNRRDWIIIAFNLTGAAFNLAWALAFQNDFTFMNWIAVGGCASMALTQPTLARWRKVVEDQNVTIIASNKAMEAVSPEQMRTMLQGTFLQVVAKMRKNGTLPPELDVQLNDNGPSKSMH